MEIPYEYNENLSIERQAYKLRYMLFALRTIGNRRNKTSRTVPHRNPEFNEVNEIAKLMKPLYHWGDGHQNSKKSQTNEKKRKEYVLKDDWQEEKRKHNRVASSSDHCRDVTPYAWNDRLEEGRSRFRGWRFGEPRAS